MIRPTKTVRILHYARHSVHQTGRVTTPLSRLLHGDAWDVLRTLESESIDLIVTSPPYADHSLFDVEHGGERHTYVLELILEMRQHGWLYTEEYLWHKKNSYPGKWPNRFRDAWERCIHLTKERRFAMYQESVRVPMGDWSKSRLTNLAETDRTMVASSGNGFHKQIDNWVGREMAYPDNVPYFATECKNVGHSAAFPEALPEWFIRLFTQEGDLVLDPFCGSGTTLVVAQRMKRDSIGIELSREFCEVAVKRVGLFENSVGEWVS